MIRQLFIIFILGNIQLFPQYTEAIEIGIKGKIKSVTSLRYDLIHHTDKGEWVPNNKELYFSKHERYFSSSSRLDSFLVHYYYSNTVHNNTYSFSSRIYYTYDTNGKKSGTNYFESPGTRKDTLVISYHWINPYCYEETTWLKNQIATKTTCYLSRDFCDSMSVIMDYYNDSLTRQETQVNERDINKNLVKITVYDSLKDTFKIRTFTYSNFDKYGNPEVVYQFGKDKKVPTSVYYRRYEYYN